MDLEKQFQEAMKKEYKHRCQECGEILPEYPHYFHDPSDSRGYAEIWECTKCGATYIGGFK